MGYSEMSSAMTVIMLAVFVGIVLWAWSGARRASFDAAARVPLDDGRTDGAAETPTRQGSRHE